MEIKGFNIRIYGLLIEEGRILLTDEFRLGIYMTKFPGGGLNFGEGPVDCLKREFLEELDSEVIEYEHYYTTEFFQPTKLLPLEFQLINVYYLVKLQKPYKFKTTEKKYDFPSIDGKQSFRWMKVADLNEEEFTFPIDKSLVERIKSDHLQ